MIDILVRANPDFSTVAISFAFHLLHFDKNNSHFGLKNWRVLNRHFFPLANKQDF